MDNPEDILERLHHYRQSRGCTQANLARQLGINPGNLSRILNGSVPLSEGFVNKVVVELGVSKRWLLDGQGPMMVESALPQGAPVYDIAITAGPCEQSWEFTHENIVGYVDLPGMPRDVVVLPVSGDSMTPVIRNGAMVAIRRVPVEPPFLWGQMYVVVLDNYRVVKYLRRNRQRDGWAILHSANPDYDDIDINLRDVKALFLVQAVLDVKLTY